MYRKKVYVYITRYICINIRVRAYRVLPHALKAKISILSLTPLKKKRKKDRRKIFYVLYEYLSLDFYFVIHVTTVGVHEIENESREIVRG